MLITKQTVAEKIGAYLQHVITVDQLVDWAENGMMEGEFDEQDMDMLRTVIARLGVADVRAFGLTWDDCEEALRQLGYSARVEIAMT
jgi:cobyrinic acid a,c-diamide synthase